MRNDQRLFAAGRALPDFPCEGLPLGVAELAQLADSAFDFVPALPEFEGMSGTCKALVEFLPETRKSTLRTDCIGFLMQSAS